jgi:hypothetical protein
MTVTTNRTDYQVPVRLPLWSTVGRAYAFWLGNLPELVRISWLWLLLTGAFAAVVSATLPEGLVADVVGELIMVPAAASIAAAWHRLLLTGDRVGRSTYLRFDSTVVGYAVLVFLIVTLPSALVTLMRSSFGDWVFGGLMGRSDDGALALLWAAMWLVASFYLTRLTIALPAMALGRREITLRTAWRASRHNTWRLAWGYLLSTAPLTMAIVGLTMWAELDRGPNVVAVLNQMLDLAGILCGMIAVSFLSLAYRHFFP